MKQKIFFITIVFASFIIIFINCIFQTKYGTLYIGESNVFLEDNLEYDCKNLIYIYESSHNNQKLNEIIQSDSFIKNSGIYSHGKIRVKIRYINLLLSTSIACPCCIKDGFPAVFIIDLSPLKNNYN